MEEYDVIVVGSGVSGGLPVAAYLQKAGATTLLIDKRHELAAFCPTNEPWAGIHTSPHVAINWSGTSPAMEDLELEKFGYRLAYGPTSFGTTHPDGKNVLIYHDPSRTADAFRKHSEKDAKLAERLQRALMKDSIDLVETLFYTPPETQPDKVLEYAFGLGRYVDIDPDTFSKMNAVQLIEELFESDHVRRTLIMGPAWQVTGHALEKGQGAFAAITGFFGRGYRGVAVGGNHSLVHALTRCFLQYGGKVLRNAAVERIVVRDGQAVGVQLGEDSPFPGEVIRAKRAIVSNVGPILTLDLIGEDEVKKVDGRFWAKMKYWKMDYRSTCVSTWILREPPSWKSEVWDPNIAKTLVNYRAWDSWEDCKRWLFAMQNSDLRGTHGYTGELVDYSALDPTAKSSEGYVVLRSEEVVPWSIRSEGGPSKWDDLREELAERSTEYVEALAPGIRKKILKHIFHTPMDLWRYNPAAVCGNVVGGDFTADQWILNRMPYRTPIKKLYMSTGVWPAQLSLMATGYNCACLVAEDLGIRKQAWWRHRPLEWLYRNIDRLMVK